MKHINVMIITLFTAACAGDDTGMEGENETGGHHDPVIQEDPCPRQDVQTIDTIQMLQEDAGAGTEVPPFISSDGPGQGDRRYTVFRLPTHASVCNELYLQLEGDYQTSSGGGSLDFRLSILNHPLPDMASLANVSIADLAAEFQPLDGPPFFLAVTPWSLPLVNEGGVLWVEEPSGNSNKAAQFTQESLAFKCCQSPEG